MSNATTYSRAHPLGILRKNAETGNNVPPLSKHTEWRGKWLLERIGARGNDNDAYVYFREQYNQLPINIKNLVEGYAAV